MAPSCRGAMIVWLAFLLLGLDVDGTALGQRGFNSKAVSPELAATNPTNKLLYPMARVS